MKKHFTIAMHTPAIYIKNGIITLLLVLCAHALFAFHAAAARQLIVIINTAHFNRTNEVIEIKRNVLGDVGKNLFPVIKKNNTALITQTVDSNNDGIWDALLIAVSIAANATDTLQIVWVEKKQQVHFDKYTNVQLSLRSDNATPSAEMNAAARSRGFVQNIAKPFYQMEGPGIENDKVAFRAFFDSRNGKDIYGKIVDTPVLEKVGVGATWHTLQPWGMDILKVGNSLGAGALAVEENKKIYRLGDADSSFFQALYEGALQAAFRLRFTNWDVATAKRNGSETVSITKGDFYYKNEIVLPLNAGQRLVAGIANFGIDHVVFKKHNASFSSVSTYGSQAEGTQTALGLAIMFSTSAYVYHQTADSASIIPNTSFVALKPSAHNTICFFACWEKSDARFSNQQGFDAYLQQTADALAQPVRFKIIKKSS